MPTDFRHSEKMKKDLILIVAVVALTGGCKKTEDVPSVAGPADRDACALLTSAEIEAVQGSSITNSKGSMNASNGLRIAQCFYSAKEPNKSVSLAITEGDPKERGPRSAYQHWEDIFGRYNKEGNEKEEKSESDREKKESLHEQQQGEGGEEESTPPKKIAGVGDEAFWTGNRVGGALYALKKSSNAFVRISVGGPDSQDVKIEKSKKLALKALERM